MENKKNKKLLYVIIIVLLAIVIIETFFIFSKKNNTQKTTDITTQNEVTVITTSVSETTEISDETESVTETEPPVLTSARVTHAYSELTEISSEIYPDAALNKNDNKLFKLKLSDIAKEDDIIESLSFTVHSEDNVTALGMLKCGFGISVDDTCPAATTTQWYAPEDISVTTEDTSYTVVCKIPDEIKEYIMISSGYVIFGHWWSDNETIILDKVECIRKSYIDEASETSES